MKILLPMTFVALLQAGISHHVVAQTNHGNHRVAAGTQTAATVETPLIEGVVTKVNKYSGRVTLFHGPLSNGTPGQTKAYGVKDEDWLDQMKVGEKIRFAVGPAQGGKKVLRFEPVP